MKIRFAIPLAVALAMSIPALAQHPEAHPQQSHENVHANQGHVPQAAPPKRDNHAKPEVEKHDGGRVNSVPHVNNDKWYGHDAPNDKRYVIARPYEHGHFEHFGPQYRYHVERFDRDQHRFWFPGGFYFEVAPWDWTLCADWCWDCGDDFTVYEDPDHTGWYMLYNVHTGAYVHVTYMGT